MRKTIFSSLLFFYLLLSSCSSVSSDAKKAATLKHESIEQARKHNLKKAEQSFKAAQKIIDKYKNAENNDKFNVEYSQAMKEISKKMKQ